jgi:hypothetical protein
MNLIDDINSTYNKLEWTPIKKSLEGSLSYLQVEKTIMAGLTIKEKAFLKEQEVILNKLRTKALMIKDKKPTKKRTKEKYKQAYINAEVEWTNHCISLIKLENPCLRILLERILLPAYSVELSFSILLDLPADVGAWWPNYYSIVMGFGQVEVLEIIDRPEIISKVTESFISNLWLASSFVNSTVAQKLTLLFISNIDNKIADKFKLLSVAIAHSRGEKKGSELVFEEIQNKLIKEVRETYNFNDVPDSWVIEVFG